MPAASYQLPAFGCRLSAAGFRLPTSAADFGCRLSALA